MCKFSAIVLVVSSCLAQHALAEEISITNQNCVWQGLSRTNQAKFHIVLRVDGTREIARDCPDHWITVGAGRTETVDMPPIAECRYVWCKAGCNYTVEAEGVPVLGSAGTKFLCSLDWADICQCRPQ